MARSSTLDIFRVTQVICLTYLLGDAAFHWSGYSYYARFGEFLPDLALMVLIGNLLAIVAAVLAMILERSVAGFLGKLGARADLEGFHAWFLVVALLVTVVKFLKIWIDPYYRIPNWGSTKYLVLAAVLAGVTGLARGMKGRFAASVRERTRPIFWLYALVSVAAVPLVLHQAVAFPRGAGPPANVSSSRPGAPNIILMTMDSLTSMDMSAWGYERPTTPFIEELARESHLFERFYANCNFTTPSVASLLTSKNPWTHQVYQLNASIPEEIRAQNLAGILRANGYTTIALVANRLANPNTLGIAGDFDIVEADHRLVAPRQRSTRVLVAVGRVLGFRFRFAWWWLRFYIQKFSGSENNFTTEYPPRLAADAFFQNLRGARAPFFAWIHLMPPHSPYLPPPPYRGTFAADDEMPDRLSQETIQGPYPPSRQDEVDALRKRYDEFILYADAQLRDFVDRLKAAGLYESSLLVLSSDHGDIFERGYYSHRGPLLYEPVIRVPLLIREPGQRNGTRIRVPGSSIDIAPTLVEYLGLPAPPWMEGRPLLPALRGEFLPPRPEFSMWLEKNRSLGRLLTTGTVAVVEGNKKLIYRLDTGRSELYDLATDPRETADLSAADAGTASRLKSLIREKLERLNAGRRGDTGPADAGRQPAQKRA